MEDIAGPKGVYKEAWTRQKRGLLILLLDQSGSMSEPLHIHGQSYSNGDMATAALNSLMASVINNASFDPVTGRRKDYCDMLVLGYGDQVVPLLNKSGNPVSVADLAAQPLGQHQVRVERPDTVQQKNVIVNEIQPYWIESFADSRKTETAQALQRTYTIVQNWLAADSRRRLSFPPIVINITDGMHNGEGDPIAESQRLQQLTTEDGHVLLFNCHMTHINTQPLVFPNEVQQIRNQIPNMQERQCAEMLFEMSSQIPATMIKRARDVFGTDLPPRTRGFMYNADAQDLINFLNWGTRQTVNKERY